VAGWGGGRGFVIWANSIFQVWNFSPPDDLESLSDRPLSLPQQQRSSDLMVPARPLSALSMDYRSTGAMQDVEMMDAGPSTAPLQHGSFFRDDLSSGGREC
jgi:F-box and WD-40 domain protein CDC4